MTNASNGQPIDVPADEPVPAGDETASAAEGRQQPADADVLDDEDDDDE